MPRSNILISSDSIIDISKNTLCSLKCDWSLGTEQCSVVLGSWFLLQEHELQHCRQLETKRTKKFVCRLPRCNARIHSSLKYLESHVMEAHMTRIQIACPITGCANLCFSRPSRLQDHFSESHKDLEGRVVDLPSDILCPLWKPFYPPCLPPQLDIPNCLPGCALLPSIKLSPARATPMRTPPSQINSQGSPRKQMLNQPSQKHQQESLPELDFEPILELSDIAGQLSKELVVRWRPPEFNRDVARPQPMHDPQPYNEPPISIHYEVFAKCLEQSEI